MKNSEFSTSPENQDSEKLPTLPDEVRAELGKFEKAPWRNTLTHLMEAVAAAQGTYYIGDTEWAVDLDVKVDKDGRLIYPQPISLDTFPEVKAQLIKLFGTKHKYIAQALARSLDPVAHEILVNFISSPGMPSSSSGEIELSDRAAVLWYLQEALNYTDHKKFREQIIQDFRAVIDHIMEKEVAREDRENRDPFEISFPTAEIISSVTNTRYYMAVPATHADYSYLDGERYAIREEFFIKYGKTPIARDLLRSLISNFIPSEAYLQSPEYKDALEKEQSKSEELREFLQKRGNAYSAELQRLVGYVIDPQADPDTYAELITAIQTLKKTDALRKLA